MTAPAAKQLLMIGAALELPGGVNAVVKLYEEQGLLARWRVRYLVSYRGKALPVQLQTMATALVVLAGLLVTRQVALVHVHSASRGSFWRKSLFCGLAWLFRTPYVFHLHSGEFPVFYRDECGALAQRWVRWVLRHAVRVGVLTPTWQPLVGAIEPRAVVHVVPNPVALPLRCRPQAAQVQRILFLGRLREKKGVFDLLEAMPAVLAAYPAIRLCLAGDGELEAVRQRAALLGVGHAVELPGWIDGERKRAELDAADILVLPSHFEGLPVCVLEAMAAGVPVVATPVGGVGFALDEGRCGVLTPVAAPAELAGAMVALLGDAERRRDIAAAARLRAERLFSSQSVALEVERLWSDCLANPRGGGRRELEQS
ncbi:MAG: glycosyltransferase family 4 protein [Rubrivivax sp.]|nr:glycosyltransferase family 4 protein [Rubrivivax sp.]MDP3086322.1 glycosyltransferase family 4 protein [Rubrivivax sp.]